MANVFSDFIRRHLVATVPDAMDQCLSCKQADCGSGDFRRCGPRLARAAELGLAKVPAAAPAGAGKDAA